jgi:chromosome segregation ATPase
VANTRRELSEAIAGLERQLAPYRASARALGTKDLVRGASIELSIKRLKSQLAKLDQADAQAAEDRKARQAAHEQERADRQAAREKAREAAARERQEARELDTELRALAAAGPDDLASLAAELGDDE